MSNNYNTKFTTTEEELEQQKNQIAKEIYRLNTEIAKKRKKKIICWCSIIIVIFTIIKSFFGTIQINNMFGYTPNTTRFYKLTVNGNPITVEYKLTHTIPIIPFLINFNSEYSGVSTIQSDNDGTLLYDDGSEKYLINIKSFSCYYDNIQVECKNDGQQMIENNDTKYTNLKITRTTKPWEEVYNGVFINDITDYLKDKGIYCVEVTAKYSLIETKIFFFFYNID